MNIIVHFPKTEEGKQNFYSQVSKVHIDTISQMISDMECDQDDVHSMLQSVISELG